MINVYMININTLPDPLDIKEKLEAFPKSRQDKILRLTSIQKRRQALASALLMHKMLTDNNMNLFFSN